MGLRIVERIKQDHGQVGEDVDVFGRGNSGWVEREGGEMDLTPGPGEDEDMGGGFLPEGYEEGEEQTSNFTSGFFPVVDEEDGEDGEDDMPLLEVDNGEVTHKPATGPAKPVSRTKPKPKAGTKAKASMPVRKGRSPDQCFDE